MLLYWRGNGQNLLYLVTSSSLHQLNKTLLTVLSFFQLVSKWDVSSFLTWLHKRFEDVPNEFIFPSSHLLLEPAPDLNEKWYCHFYSIVLPWPTPFQQSATKVRRVWTKLHSRLSANSPGPAHLSRKLGADCSAFLYLTFRVMLWFTLITPPLVSVHAHTCVT